MKRLAVGVLSLTCASAAAAPATAQVVLKPNQITGSVGFSNSDPTILGVLKDLCPVEAYLYLSSVTPSGFSASTGVSWPLNVLDVPYLMHPNAAGGVTYDMYGRALFSSAGANPGIRSYNYAQRPAGFLPDPDVDPVGLAFDLSDCVGLVHLKWGANADCTVPATAQGAEITTPSFSADLGPASSNYLVTRSGVTEARRLITHIGTDPTTDLLRFGTDLPTSVACDQIQDVCIDLSAYGSGGSAVGAFSGPFDVLGETQTGQTLVVAYNGPDGNMRYRYPTPFKSTEASPADWWTLPNLMPGKYDFYGFTVVRSGRQANFVLGHIASPEAASGVTSHLQRNIGGVSRYPLVMTPATMSGSVRLADPYVVANPGASSPLSALRFSTDVGTEYPSWTLIRTQSTTGNLSRTSFPGAFNPVTGDLLSSYQGVLVNAYDETASWRSDLLQLYFDDLPTQRKGSLYISPNNTSSQVPPGQSATFDHRYCFNEIKLGYVSENGTFLSPRADLSGSFDGTDWEGHAKSYDVSANFDGQTPGNQPATAADVRITVPQGTFTVTPVADVGGTTANFTKVNITAGCGQRINLTAGLAVSLDQLATCPGAVGSLPVSGSVDSQGQAVNRIWYKINGGPDVELCSSNCGVSPTFSGTVQLPPGCASTIEVFASSPGVALPASSAGTVDACSEACQSDECDDGAEEGIVQCATVQRGLYSDVADSDIDIDYGTWAAGGFPFVWTGFSPHAHRTLTQFDVSFIPRGATVVSATASWYVMWNMDHQIARAHKIVEPWGEATVTWPNFGDDSTFDAPVLGSFDAYGLGWKSVGLTDMYQDIVSCDAPDHGVILESDVPPDAPTVAHAYAASEASTHRPKLEICWIPGCHAGCNP